MKKLRILAISALTLTLLSNTAFASFGCKESYDIKLSRIEKHRTMRGIGSIALIVGFVLPAAVAGTIGGAVTLGLPGMMLGGAAAGSGAAYLTTAVIDRESTLRDTYEVFNLAELTHEEAFMSWQNTEHFHNFFKVLLKNKTAFDHYLQLANKTDLNGEVWNEATFRAFCLNPIMTNPENIFGEKYSNVIDELVKFANSKGKEAADYEQVRTEIKRIADTEACSKKRLMGFQKMKKTLLKAL